MNEVSAMADRPSAALHPGFHQGNLLNVAVRREIADLNRLFLERALDPDEGLHDWFRLPCRALERLAAAGSETWERAAQWPMALFELRLPGAGLGDSDVHTVADRPLPVVGEGSRTEARRAFGVTALGVVRRLAEGVPLASRIAFGLEGRVEARLSAMTLSESYRVAAWPGLIRPRWSEDDRYWMLLAEAATRGDGVHWAYTAGLCLLARCERQPPAVAYSVRRAPRSAHRRSGAAGPEVPC
ncbi:MAG TPA: hypothetical protein VFI92_02555 [Steroidobacteraceae bacterium]|nr:hypothetical protein [Steroidobacteraceae bacterium]